MPRQPDGTVTLPLPAVISGTTIESNWGNTTMEDMRSMMQDSLSRSGQGGMSSQLKIVDGATATPGMAFVNEANTGMYRPDAGDFYFAVLGQDYMRLSNTNGAQFSTDGGATWVSFSYSYERTIVDITWSNNNLTFSRAEGVPTVVPIKEMVEFKSGGVIRHLSSNSVGAVQTADTTDQSRFTVDNNGNMTLTVIRPSGADPELGETYCTEGSVLITNGATPGTITLNNDAGAIPGLKILGAQNTDVNAVMVLTYLIHRTTGDVYHEVYSWCT